jgi:ABC-type sugar transport system ATPase subunit
MLDEPTAASGVEETGEVKRLIRHLSDNQGLPIIVISHNLQDVFDISSRIVVFRHGKKVADLVTANSTPEDVIAHITGVAPAHVLEVG